MALLRRSKAAKGRNPSGQPGAPKTAPVLRYYRPERSVRGGAETSRKQSIIARASEPNGGNAFRRVIQLALRYFGVILVVALLIVNLTISDARIRIDDREYRYRSAEAYQKGVDKLLQSSFFNYGKLTISTRALEEEIARNFPELSDVTIVVPLVGRTLTAHLQPAEPLARVSTGGSAQSILTSTGTIVLSGTSEEIQSTFAGLPLLSMPALEAEVGTQLLTSQETALIRLIIDEFDESTNYRPRVTTIEYDVKKREIKLRFESKTFFARLTPEREERAQVGTLVATLKQLDRENRLPAEYVDVRVEGRVFIK